MPQSIFTRRSLLFFCVAQCICLASMGQVKYIAYANIHSMISGTSTLHAWKMKTSTGECKAIFILNAAQQLTGLAALSLSIPATSLKSDNKSMDKNAYKALKTKDNESITFDLVSATVSPDGDLKCFGKLTIAGTAVETELHAVAKVNADKTISVTGSKNISMKDYKMVPPSFMLGAVKTGNDIVLNFDLILTKL